MSVNKDLLDEVFSGEKSICFFVHEKVCYWVLDDKYNFSLDAEKDYDAYLNKGVITRQQYLQACKEFRGGILKLTSDNFLQYIDSMDGEVLSMQALAGLFDADEICDIGGLLKAVEAYYLTGAELSADHFHSAGRVASRLPQFYVNFDRKIYMHMDVGRFHEELAYAGWFAKCADFNFLIPDSERYWVKNGDCWKLRFVQQAC